VPVGFKFGPLLSGGGPARRVREGVIRKFDSRIHSLDVWRGPAREPLTSCQRDVAEQYFGPVERRVVDDESGETLDVFRLADFRQGDEGPGPRCRALFRVAGRLQGDWPKFRNFGIPPKAESRSERTSPRPLGRRSSADPSASQ